MSEDRTAYSSIQSLRETWNQCTLCSLCETRSNIVCGRGNPYAQILVIGDAPSDVDDKMGIPFSGPQGDFLEQFIELSQLPKDTFYFSTLVACTPPKFRDPSRKELKACAPRVKELLGILKPDAIVALGALTGKALIRPNFSVAEIHGVPHSITVASSEGDKKVMVIPMQHPKLLLKHGSGLKDGNVHRTAQYFAQLGDTIRSLNTLREGIDPWK